MIAAHTEFVACVAQAAIAADALAELDVPAAEGDGSKWDGLTASSHARKAARARWDHRGGAG
ncbi:MAG: hypothetical protein WCP98_01085 [Actinomycetes bacterium]